MVPFETITRVVTDAARLVVKGEVVVTGSAVVAFWVPEGPPARFVELCITPEAAAQQVAKLMSMDGWYDRTFGHHVLVSPNEGFVAPERWAARARRIRLPEASAVEVVAPHPHDVIMSKLERFDAQDQAQVKAILLAMPMDESDLVDLKESMPQRAPGFDEARRARFDFNVTRLATNLLAI